VESSLRERDRRALQISRENAEPVPFALDPQELLVIQHNTSPSKKLHLGSLPDEVRSLLLRSLFAHHTTPSLRHLLAVARDMQVLVYMLCFLDEVSLGRISMSCKKTYSLSREPVLWRLICQRYLPWAPNVLTLLPLRLIGTYHTLVSAEFGLTTAAERCTTFSGLGR